MRIMSRSLRARHRRSPRYALDASVLSAIVNSDDVEHFSCYSFYRNLDDNDKALWVVPGLIFFEFQATQSRRYQKSRPGQPVFRHAPLNYENTELFEVTKKFLRKVYDLKLYDTFTTLRGADLLYACIARVERIPLVTHDSDFDIYSKDLTLIRPRDLMRRTSTVSVEHGGKLYTVGYETIKDSSGGIVRLNTGQATHVGGMSPNMVAECLLREMIDTGLADRMGLGRPKE